MSKADELRMRVALERYHAAIHAMQSGVKFDQESGSDDGTPKHLRVGVNSALSDQAALVQMLIKKGVITEIEYLEAIAEQMEAEKKKYEELLTKKFGKKVVLH